MSNSDPTLQNPSWNAPTRLNRVRKPPITQTIDDDYTQLVQIQSFGAWLWLGAFGALALAVVLWAIFGSIPTFARGEAEIRGDQAVIQLQGSQTSSLAPGMPVQFACETPLEGEVSAVDGAIVRAVVRNTLLETTETLYCAADIQIGVEHPIQRLLN